MDNFVSASKQNMKNPIVRSLSNNNNIHYES